VNHQAVVICDIDALDVEEQAKLENAGYLVIRKKPTRQVEICWLPSFLCPPTEPPGQPPVPS